MRVNIEVVKRPESSSYKTDLSFKVYYTDSSKLTEGILRFLNSRNLSGSEILSATLNRKSAKC